MRCQPWLGTFVSISITEESADAVDQAFAAVARVHRCMSFHDADSDLSRLNRATAGRRLRVGRDIVRVLRFSLDLYEKSAGAFDVTVGKSLVASGFLPRPAGVDLRRMTGGMSDIEVDDDEHVILHRPMLIDLGGVAKGYAVDQAIEALEQSAIRVAVVNAGGDLRVLGAARVHLRDADGAIAGALDIRNASVATSSNCHSRRRHRGRNVTPHIGPRRIPILAHHAVTVVADNCMAADSLTKVALTDAKLAQSLIASSNGHVIALPYDQVPERGQPEPRCIFPAR